MQTRPTHETYILIYVGAFFCEGTSDVVVCLFLTFTGSLSMWEVINESIISH